MRRTGNIIEDFITLTNGTTRVVKNGIDLGTFTNVVYDNTDLASRDYDGLLLQSRYSVNARWSVNGHYTLMLRNEGNYEGESGEPARPSQHASATSPRGSTRRATSRTGRLQDFQRHKVRMWSIYSLNMGRAGSASVSGLWRLQSGEVYSLKATNQALTATQLALLAEYPNIPSSQTVYFGERGSQDFIGYGLVDTSINYDIPVFRSLRPWLKFDVFNLLDNQKQIKWNTTVRQDAGQREGQPRTRHRLHARAELREGRGEQQLPDPDLGSDWRPDAARRVRLQVLTNDALLRPSSKS